MTKNKKGLLHKIGSSITEYIANKKQERLNKLPYGYTLGANGSRDKIDIKDHEIMDCVFEDERNLLLSYLASRFLGIIDKNMITILDRDKYNELIGDTDRHYVYKASFNKGNMFISSELIFTIVAEGTIKELMSKYNIKYKSGNTVKLLKEESESVRYTIEKGIMPAVKDLVSDKSDDISYGGYSEKRMTASMINEGALPVVAYVDVNNSALNRAVKNATPANGYKIEYAYYLKNQYPDINIYVLVPIAGERPAVSSSISVLVGDKGVNESVDYYPGYNIRSIEEIAMEYLKDRESSNIMLKDHSILDRLNI